MNRSALGILTALTAYGIFGFSYLFTKVALEVTTPFVLLSVRFTVAFLTMSLIVLTGKVKLNLKGKPVRYLMGLGIVQPVLYFICENYGLSLTSASYSGIIMGMVPVSGMILGRVIMKEQVTLLQAVCAVCSVIGVALTAMGGPVAFSLLGTLLLVGSVFAGPLFNVISRSIADQFTAFERTYVMMGFGCDKGYSAWKSRFMQIKNRFSFAWKYHQIYQKSLLWELLKSVFAFLFERHPKL